MVPVSSSAQLVLLPWLLRWEQPAERTAFAAALHAGSCAGIAWALRRELRSLDRRTVVLVAASTLPAAVTGLVAADAVEERLGRPPQLAALLAAAGALMWWVDARPGRPALAEVGPRETAYAALAQVAALVPGVSRSGATLSALRAAGVDRAPAQRFALLMSLPVTAGAAALTLARTRGGARTAAPGVATAALAGAVTAGLQARRPGRPVTAAAVYRLGLAAVVARRLRREGDA